MKEENQKRKRLPRFCESLFSKKNEVIQLAKPEKRFRCGGCEAAIFENEILRAGNVLKIKKVAFQKRYKTADGEWKTTYSLDINEIPKAILALSKAYEFLILGNEIEGDSNVNAQND